MNSRRFNHRQNYEPDDPYAEAAAARHSNIFGAFELHGPKHPTPTPSRYDRRLGKLIAISRGRGLSIICHNPDDDEHRRLYSVGERGHGKPWLQERVDYWTALRWLDQ
jgi:hypothetical protein